MREGDEQDAHEDEHLDEAEPLELLHDHGPRVEEDSFDVEAIFFYPWAVLLRQLKWFGLIEMLVFMGILLVALAHIWRKGGLDWE